MKDFEKYGRLLINEKLDKYTSFKIGGVAKAILFPKDEECFIYALKEAKEKNLEYIVLGNCTNVLIDSKGYDGLVIMLRSVLNNIEVDKEKAIITAGAGATLKSIANKALESSLTGFEALHGIPGTLGGGIIMNAGAYDGELKDVVESVRLLDGDFNLITLNNEQMKFGYRKSIAQEKDYIVLSATIKLRHGDYELIKEEMEDLLNRRRVKQPLELPSAGSTFRRPVGYFAGKLIEDSGLRGYRHKGAMISEKHCGFVVNVDRASSNDVKELIATVQKIVYDKFKIELKCEVKYIGD